MSLWPVQLKVLHNEAVPSTDVNDYLTAVDLKVSNGVVYVNALQRSNSTSSNQFSYIRSNWGFIEKERA